MNKLMQESESEVMRKKERRGVCAFAGERVCLRVCVCVCAFAGERVCVCACVCVIN